jgi:error-prone DNA polymerase
VLEEAKHLGVPVLGVEVNRSRDSFSVERVGSPPGRWAIRIGLRQVAQVGEALAEAIVWERRPAQLGADSAQAPERPFTSLMDLCQRLRPAGLTWTAAQALVLAGACDGLAPRMDRRRRLWQLHELWPLVGPVAGERARRRAPTAGADITQLALRWEPEALTEPPSLPALDREERVALDYQLLGLSARPHPMHLLRRELQRRGVRAIAELALLPEGRMVRVAGWPISAQRPPTAKGMGFLVLEDETARLPVALPPRLAREMHRVIRGSRVVAVVGRVERVRWYRSLLAADLFSVEATHDQPASSRDAPYAAAQ